MMNEFKTSLPLEWRYYFSVEGFYKKMYLKTVYSADIRDYNRAHNTKYAGWNEVRLPRAWRDIQNKREKTDWEDFVRNTLALQWVRADDSARPAYQAYLQAKYENMATLNRRYGTKYQSFGDVPLIGEPPLFGLAASDWENFITGWKDPDTRVIHKAPVESLRIFSVEYLFRDYLRQKYKTVENMNRSLQTSFASFEQALPPQRSLHYRGFMDNKRSIKWDFIARNYKTVVEYMVFHGRGIINTVIYCTLAVLIALLVNPLAAYALSRYKMPPTYKILLFLMATMAFPAMVTQIPNFLMLRRLNLLNTFAALVLPGMANGYSIFLLKGFFDSLPRELYESAQLDGASEWTMFWSMTMSLSKPILAVIALSAFTHAYANFMFAFVVCQDEKMWTLMVWLYQLRQMSGQAVMYASLIIAAIPTFIIFLFCQNIIMRGIVVPSEK
jgi:multiple sugar transport system permease protein